MIIFRTGCCPCCGKKLICFRWQKWLRCGNCGVVYLTWLKGAS